MSGEREIKQYEVELRIHVTIPTSAVNMLGARTLAKHSAELAFANINDENIYAEVMDVREV